LAAVLVGLIIGEEVTYVKHVFDDGDIQKELIALGYSGHFIKEFDGTIMRVISVDENGYCEDI